MANICEKILTGCISVSCSNPVFEGCENTAWIFNKSQIASLTYDQTDPNVITAITMDTHEVGSDDVAYVGYQILNLGKTPYTGTNITLQEGNISNSFNETVVFSVQDNSPLCGALLDGIANGSFLVVLENQYDGSDNRGKFQVYGAKKGLKCTAMERQAYDDTQNGGWSVTLTAEKAPMSSVFIEHKTGTAVDTKTYLNTLAPCE